MKYNRSSPLSSKYNKPNAAGVPRCLLKNLTSDLEKWVKVTRNVNLSEIFYRYIFGINLRSLRDFVIELTRSQDFHKKWPVTLTLRFHQNPNSPEIIYRYTFGINLRSLQSYRNHKIFTKNGL